MTIDEINSKIIDIWMGTSANIRGEHLPTLISSSLTQTDILFVGINPSISPAIAKALAMPANITQSHVDAIHAEGIAALGAKGNTGFFNIFNQVSQGKSWRHIDLFFKREANQRAIERELEGANSFWQQQLNLFPHIVSHINPKVVCVANALASRIINFKLHGLTIPGTEVTPVTFQEHGWDTLKIAFPDSPTFCPPIFFSSMLSGQRALDIYSRRRLSWHIMKALL